LLTPLGIEDTWEKLVAGDSAVGPIEGYDVSSLRTQVGAEITSLKARDYVDRRAMRTMTRYDLLSTVGGVLAMRDAGLETVDDPEGRFALYTASGKEISEPEHFEQAAVAVRGEGGVVDMQRFGELAFEQVHPLFYIEGLQGASLFYLSDAYMMRGPNTFFAGAAEAGLTAVGSGYRAIRRGEADIALAGGGDAPVSWWNMSKIDSVQLTTANGVCRPYDVERDGTAMGEGGAFVVMEELEAAQTRGAHIYAEIIGFGSSTDIEHMLTPDPTGRPLADAIRSAIPNGDKIDYIATHGSGTQLGDSSEAHALRDTFGGSAPAASSIKAATGHLGAAAGAANAVVAALAIDRQLLPPTLNLKNIDPACAGIDWVIDQAREAPVREALALARGFEGQNVALALRAVR
jgi:3-oxoacyl-[acyl-carrier-protein] synthase II